jgi:hypothetical protein
MLQSDFGNQTLEPLAPFCCGARLTSIFIDDQDAGFRPSPGHRPLDQTVVPPGRLLMLQDLLHRRLPDIHDGETLEVPSREFLAGPLPRITSRVQTHDRPPPRMFRP